MKSSSCEIKSKPSKQLETEQYEDSLLNWFVGCHKDRHQKYEKKLVDCQAMILNQPINSLIVINILRPWSSDLGDSMVDWAYEWYHEDFNIEISTAEATKGCTSQRSVWDSQIPHYAVSTRGESPPDGSYRSRGASKEHYNVKEEERLIRRRSKGPRAKP